MFTLAGDKKLWIFLQRDLALHMSIVFLIIQFGALKMTLLMKVLE